jgi:P4 family phage/plasmid primase-like protien
MADDGIDGIRERFKDADNVSLLFDGRLGFDLSHDKLALDLGGAGWDRDAKYVASWHTWLFWTGSYWRRDDRLEHLTRARKFLRTVSQDVMAWAEAQSRTVGPQKGEKLVSWAKAEGRSLKHKQTVTAVVDLARSNSESVATVDSFDVHPHLLGTPAGTIDLRTGQISKPRRSDMISKQCAIGPAGGQPEHWLRLLDVAFDGDKTTIDFIRRALGYSLTGETRESKLFFCYGTGANGKSSVLNLVFHVLADYARRAAASTFLSSNREAHPTDLAGLQGARLVVASELPKGKTWDESTLKDLTGGDTLTARYMRGDFFDFKPVAKLWIAGNTQPSFRGVDEAMRRRLVLIPFTVTVPPEERDPKLPEKLITEAPQILNWMIQGAMDWYANGLHVPSSIKAASEEYLDDEDLVGQFLADETAPDPGGFVTTTSLHERFSQWTARQGITSPWTVRTFQKAMLERGLRHERRMHGRGFVGLRLVVGGFGV